MTCMHIVLTTEPTDDDKAHPGYAVREQRFPPSLHEGSKNEKMRYVALLPLFCVGGRIRSRPMKWSAICTTSCPLRWRALAEGLAAEGVGVVAGAGVGDTVEAVVVAAGTRMEDTVAGASVVVAEVVAAEAVAEGVAVAAATMMVVAVAAATWECKIRRP